VTTRPSTVRVRRTLVARSWNEHRTVWSRQPSASARTRYASTAAPGSPLRANWRRISVGWSAFFQSRPAATSVDRRRRVPGTRTSSTGSRRSARSSRRPSADVSRDSMSIGLIG
jgi:hypothetical protein